MRSHRILVCGLGSVGERHVGNLLRMGQRDLALFRTRGLPPRTVDPGLPVFSDLDEALGKFAPDVVIVCNPTALHLPTALAAARHGAHVLVEKPVAHSLDGTDELIEVLRANGRFGMVAYMMRFHPLMRTLKSWLEEGPDGTLGRPLYAHVSWGEHVPDWHPWEDYTETYAVRRDLGGGPALTYSHDLDLISWLFGKPERVHALASRTDLLAGDTEHGVDWLFGFSGGATAHLHANYFTRPPARVLELVATRGRVVFDYFAGTMTRFSGHVGERPPATGAVQPEALVLRVPEGFERNDMFVAEMKYFLECIERGETPRPDIADGCAVLRLALAGTRGNSSQLSWPICFR